MSERSRWWLLVSVLFGLLSSNINFTIFNVALVQIAGDLHTTQSTLTWAITGPLLVVGVAAPLLGKLGDLKGHRNLYLMGLVGSLVCAGLTAGAWNAPSLIVARLFSGLGAACLTASSWSLLFRVFGPAERTKVLGWWSLVGAGGPVIGVAAGGPVVQYFGWRWIFVAQVPLIVVALISNRSRLPDTERAQDEQLDVAGALLLALGIGALLLFLNEGSRGWTHPAVLVSVGASIVSLAVFGVVERRRVSPIFPLEWLSRRNFTMPCVAGFAVNFAYMGGFFLTPLFLERGLHYSIGSAGLLQIARPLLFAISAPAAGYLAIRTGERSAALAGVVLMIASMVVFAVLRPGESVFVILIALGASGLASGISMPPISAMVANAVDVRHMGSASAGLQVANQVGVVAGIQLMETVQASREHLAGVVGSFHDAYVAGALVTVVAVVATLLMRPLRIAASASVLGTATFPGTAAPPGAAAEPAG